MNAKTCCKQGGDKAELSGFEGKLFKGGKAKLTCTKGGEIKKEYFCMGEKG